MKIYEVTQASVYVIRICDYHYTIGEWLTGFLMPLALAVLPSRSHLLRIAHKGTLRARMVPMGHTENATGKPAVFQDLSYSR